MRHALYYASDKAVSDALNNHRIKNEQLDELFTSRGIILSNKTSRKNRASYFSRLNHDYFDYELIASKLSSSSARERNTTVSISNSDLEIDDVEAAMSELLQDLSKADNEVKLNRNGNKIKLMLDYTVFDTTKSELSQATRKSAEIDVELSCDGFLIRSPENDEINKIRSELLDKIAAKSNDTQLDVSEIELTAIDDPHKITDFFQYLIDGLSGAQLQTVTEVFVHNGDEVADGDNFIQKVALKGHGLNTASELDDLTSASFYIVKIVWDCKLNDEESGIYTLEAQFKDPINKTRFAYQVRCVKRRKDDGTLYSSTVKPTQTEDLKLLRLIERSAKEAMNKVSGFNDEQKKPG